jgi:hypothetical protein
MRHGVDRLAKGVPNEWAAYYCFDGLALDTRHDLSNAQGLRGMQSLRVRPAFRRLGIRESAPGTGLA